MTCWCVVLDCVSPKALFVPSGCSSFCRPVSYSRGPTSFPCCTRTHTARGQRRKRSPSIDPLQESSGHVRTITGSAGTAGQKNSRRKKSKSVCAVPLSVLLFVRSFRRRRPRCRDPQLKDTHALRHLTSDDTKQLGWRAGLDRWKTIDRIDRNVQYSLHQTRSPVCVRISIVVVECK